MQIWRVSTALLLFGVCSQIIGAVFIPDDQYTNELISARAQLHAQQPQLGTNLLEYLAASRARSNRLAQLLPRLLTETEPNFPNASALLQEFCGSINNLEHDGCPLMLLAVDEGRSGLLNFLLSHNADPNVADTSGNTPLHRAIQFRRGDVALLLIQAGASVTRTNHGGESAGALYFQNRVFFQADSDSLLAHLLAHGLDPFSAERTGEAKSLVELCLRREENYQSSSASVFSQVGDMLLTNAASPIRFTPGGDTALHLAVAYRRTNAIEFLLDSGFSIDQTNRFGLTALQRIVGSGDLRNALPVPGPHPTVAEYLLTRGATLDVFSAAGLGRTNELAAILEAEPELANARDGVGRTPLHYAIINAGSFNGGPRFVFPGGAFSQAASPQARRVQGWSPGSPLSVPAAVLLLLRSGADPNIATTAPVYDLHLDLLQPAGTTPLHLAAAHGHTPLIRELLLSRADIAAADSEGNTPLHMASRTWAKSAVELLIRAKASLEITNRIGFTPLRAAVEAGADPCAELLLDAGANPTNGLNGDTLLHTAAKQGRLETARLLLKHKCALDGPDAKGRTAFQLAVLAQQRDMFRFLVDEGANINAADLAGNNILHLQSLKQDDSVYHASDESGFRAWQREQSAKQSLVGKALGLLAKGNIIKPPAPLAWTNSSITAWLVDHGARADITNHAGQTPLYLLCSQPWTSWAPRTGPSSVTNRVADLLRAGGQLDVADTNGLSALHLAMMRGHPDYLALLLALAEPGALTRQDALGRTLLHHAVLAGNQIGPVTNLLARGANPNAKDRAGQTPLHVALQLTNDARDWQRRELALALLKAGANPNLPDARGVPPLMTLLDLNATLYSTYASQLISLLLTNGAELNIPDRDGNNVLHRTFLSATNRGRIPQLHLVASLTKQGASLSATNHAGATPLHVLFSLPHSPGHTWGDLPSLVDVQDPAFEVRDAAGNTPLHLWASSAKSCGACADQFRKVLTVGNHLWLTNASGETPLTLLLVNAHSSPALGQILQPSLMTPELLATRDPEGAPLLFRVLEAKARPYFNMGGFLDKTMTNPQLLHLTNYNGDTSLHVVLRQGNPYLPRMLMQAGADPLHPNVRGETPLQLAAIYLPSGPVDVRPPGARMPFFIALNSPIVSEAFRWLDADPALARITNRFGVTPLQAASTRGPSPVTDRLLQLGAPLDPLSALRLNRMKDFDSLVDARKGELPPDEWLREAVRLGCAEGLEKLIGACGNVNCEDDAGHSLLFCAEQGGQFNLAVMLRERECQLTLFDIVARGDTNRVDAILKTQPERITETNRTGTTLLYRAITADQPDMAKLLLSHRAPVDTRVPGGWTALHAAVANSSPACAKILLQHGASPSVFAGQGMGPLHIAAARGSADMVRLLLEYGAEVNARPPEPDPDRGNTPLHWAAHYGRVDVFKLLLQHGADVHLLNGRKLTPLQYAELTKRGEHWGFLSPLETPERDEGVMFRAESCDAALAEMNAAVEQLNASHSLNARGL